MILLKREELLLVQPNLELVISANHRPRQLMFQDADTGLYLNKHKNRDSRVQAVRGRKTAR